MNDRDISKFYQ